MSRPFRFGVQVWSAPHRAGWIELVCKIEDRGYSSVTMPDHFDGQFAPNVALMAAADATEHLRLGNLVLCNDYRHPVMVAKEAATLDLLSEGRLELGIGAGWMTSDYNQAGLPLDPAGVRIKRMAESVEIIKGLFAGGPLSYQGKYYKLDGLEVGPQPHQRPHPPFLIGGGGPRMLRLAGEMADIVGVHTRLTAGVMGPEAISDATAERYDQKIEWVKEGAGDRFDDLELMVRAFVVVITDDRQAVAESLASGFGMSAEDGLASPLAMVGTPSQIADDLRQRRERWGVSYIVIGIDDYEAFAPVVAELAGT